MKRRVLWFLVPAVLLAASVFAASPAPTVEQQVDALLRPLLEEDLISGSILIARGGKVEVAKGYGWANREHAVPCGPETRYRLASMTKAFTAMAVMILEERGLLRVDDTLDKYIPDYPGGSDITLHHLLTHTSGVVNYSALPDHYRVWTMPHSVEQVIERFKNEPLRFAPGERFEYSNSGYVLLTYVIEKVSGRSYEEFLQENVFKPLGMEHSGVDSHTAVIPGRATGHYNFGDGIVQAPYLDVGFTSGAGSLYSTVTDLYKWDRALRGSGLVSEATLKRMLTPGLGGYGYGWFIHDESGRRLVEHRGGLNGFLTSMERYVDDDVVVIALFNYVSTFSREVNRALAAIAFDEPWEPVLRPAGVAVSEQKLTPLVGSYRLGDSSIAISLVDGSLRASLPELERAPLVPQGDSVFWLREANALLRFPVDEHDRVTRLILQQSERLIPCPRIE